MKRILVAFDALEMNQNTLDFAMYIGRLTGSKIAGVFLEDLVSENKIVIKEGYDATYMEWGPDETEPDYQAKMEQIKNNINLFRDYCTKRDTACDVLCEKGTPAREIIRESRFADLIIMNAQTCFNKRFRGSPTTFEKQILKASECPVIIAPKCFNPIDEIIFCYDGSRSSFFSIKQFDYLFPELLNTKVILLSVNKMGMPNLPEDEKVNEWLFRRYTHIHFDFRYGKARDELYYYLLQKNNCMVIMGAFGRNSISRLFKGTTAENILKAANLPIFITHP